MGGLRCWAAGRSALSLLLVGLVPMSIVLILATTLALLAAILLLLARGARAKTGIPAGEGAGAPSNGMSGVAAILSPE